MSKKVRSTQSHQSVKTLGIFVVLSILYYYLVFSWNIWLWFVLVAKLNLHLIFGSYRDYVDFFFYSTRILLTLLTLVITFHYYKKSYDKVKFWKYYAIFLFIFILLSLVALYPIGAV